MTIAIPTADGRLCPHFGHCDVFTLVDVDRKAGKVLGTKEVIPPPHEPGKLPPWVAGQGATLVIAGGMGQRAVMLFNEAGVEVIVGAAAEAPRKVVEDWLAGELATGSNACDH
jgi:predicted Fe-Mo cluster-binding NifX family protein